MPSTPYAPAQLVRNNQFDMMRTLAILGVLVIHSVGRYAQSPAEQVLAEGLRLLMRPAIAIFLFLAGALFVAKPVGQARLVEQYKRVVIPYLIFSLFALYYQLRLDLFTQIAAHPGRIVGHILLGNTFGVYYYVFVIVAMYGIGFILWSIPALRWNIVPCTMLAYLLNSVENSYGQLVWQQWGFTSEDYIFYADRSPLVWTCFFLTGMLYQYYGWQRQIVAWKGWLRGMWCLIGAIYMGLYLSGLPLMAIDGYHSSMGTAYAVATIGGLLTLDLPGKLWRYISERSYFIYLSHIFFVYGLLNTLSQTITHVSLWWSLASLSISLLGSLILHWLLKRLLPQRMRRLVAV